MGNLGSRRLRRVLAVDDHASVIEALRRIITPKHGLKLVGVASDGFEAVEKFRALKPDLIIMDENMPRRSGVSATREIREIDSSVRILFYSGDLAAAEAALAAGANGFASKSSPTEHLKLAIQVALNDEIYLDHFLWPILRERLMLRQLPLPQFDHEEMEIIPHLINGLTSKQIAYRINKNPRRVEKVRAHLMRKLDAKNGASLLVKLIHCWSFAKAPTLQTAIPPSDKIKKAGPKTAIQVACAA